MKKIIGVDIGGTKMHGVLWDGKRVVKALELPTPKTLTDFKTMFLKMVEALGRTSDVAIGAAGVISGKKIVESPNIPYLRHFDFSFLGPKIKVKALDNDARCFARAEYGTGKYGKKTVLFLTIGTGIGRALGKKGRIVKIKKFEYPEAWEGEYQKIRDLKNDKRLARYLAPRIAKLARDCHSKEIVVGGGVAKKDIFCGAQKTRVHTDPKTFARQKWTCSRGYHAFTLKSLFSLF